MLLLVSGRSVRARMSQLSVAAREGWILFVVRWECGFRESDAFFCRLRLSAGRLPTVLRWLRVCLSLSRFAPV